MKISFVLLAHEKPETIKDLIVSLLSAGSNIYAHYDASADHDLEVSVASWGLDELPGRIYFAERVKVVWGEWSIVKATLNCLRVANSHGADSDYFMLISGSCFPVKPITFLKQSLKGSCVDYIESVNAEKNRWVTGGLQEERWERYHYFNWRYQEFLFETSLAIQNKLKIRRKIPLKHVAHMGSQWWCLRRETVQKVLAVIDENPSLVAFYKRTWVPDELFIQTLVANLVSDKEIVSEPMTRYSFNSWGIPRVYYDDDYPELLAENRFFVRKVSHRAVELRRKLSFIAQMEVEAYAQLLDDSVQEREAFVENLKLKSFVNKNRWHSLDSGAENPYDFIKSIPNRIVVLCGLDSKLKSQALAQLDRLEDTVVYGDLFNPKEVSKGFNAYAYLPVKNVDTTLARHKWHLLIGDIAFNSPGKTIVFSLGKDALDYLDVLRWRDNLNIMLVDGHKTSLYDKGELCELYFKSKVLHLLKDRHCELTRISAGDLRRVIDTSPGTALMVDSVRRAIVDYRENVRWPSLLKQGHDPYELIKSIECKIVVLAAKAPNLLDSAKGMIDKLFGGQVCEDFFNVIPENDLSLDWHYYLADVAHIYASIESGNFLCLYVGPEHLRYLETIRWKNDLLVIEVEDQELSVSDDLSDFKYEVGGSLKSIEGAGSFHRLLAELLEDRHCQYTRLQGKSVGAIEQKLKEFLSFGKPLLAPLTESTSRHSSTVTLPG